MYRFTSVSLELANQSIPYRFEKLTLFIGDTGTSPEMSQQTQNYSVETATVLCALVASYTPTTTPHYWHLAGIVCSLMLLFYG